MTTCLTTLSTCLALCVAIAGCGGGDDNDDRASATAPALTSPASTQHTSTSTETVDEAPPKAGQARGKKGKRKHKPPTKLVPNVSVSIEPDAFRPDGVTIAKGGTVTWTNHGKRPCDVTKASGPGADFSSGKPGKLRARARWYTTFDTRGQISYVCKAHPDLVGTVTVR
jgi:plastocyanin